jgi:hypothetical protein
MEYAKTNRDTVRAAIEEADNMNQPVHITFSINGTINLPNRYSTRWILHRW